MKKHMIKNIIICALAVTCALLTVRLWFGNFLIQGLFPNEPVVAASPAHQRMAGGMIESARMTIKTGADEEMQETVYSGLSAHLAWEISVKAISELINEGSFDRSGTLDEAFENQIFSQEHIAIQYNFSMPTSFFREQFGQRPGFLSSVFGSFETLLIAPQQGVINFYFISNESTFHIFILEDEQIYDDFLNYFAQEPQYIQSSDFEIAWRNPIGEQMLHADVRPFVLFFFPNPVAASEGVTINGVYTYVDSTRTVKFYPNNIVELNALLGVRSSGPASLASSLLAALDMLDRDKASMQARGEPMNDVFLAGYSFGPSEEQWNFYFDYIVGGRPMDIHGIKGIDAGALSHAVEIRVMNNTVVQYRRLMLNFFESVNAYEY